ncbi:Retrovirus-related Pol polyprotein from transposon TNT 1-94 [Vitis vinifera]|uniref:Retrovirus-related Pol polyprotein from transposon TNT 1-94 n=1 Tax=Vitis vinifera TaxID=29760 RepID=A0A438HEM3_VITVI|nr:Retrovirus-related Pol polyprotein from transposon TNT 1-94 [Vitis vinifera]
MSLMIMKHSILEAIRGAIPEETLAKTFLDQIANRFSTNKKVETNTILSKLVSMRYKGKENIREYIMEMSNLVTKLKALKERNIETRKNGKSHLASTSQGFGTNKKRKRDNKGKQTAVSRTSKQKGQKKQDKEITCFFCKKAGHMKKTYTSATTHISVTMQGCLRSRMLTDGERYIYVGNDNKVVVKAIDICGQFPTPSWNGQQYFITFIDDCWRYGYLYLTHEKSQSLDVFKNFKTEVKNQLSKKIKAIRSDHGGEYYGRYDGSSEQCPGPFAKYLMECGIIPQYTMSGTPKRRNRTLKDMGCPTEARPYKPNEKKLDSRIVSYYLVGYSERSRGFKFYDPSTRSFFETGNAKFIEDVELSGREPLRKVVFEEEFVSIPTITIGHGHIMFDDTIHNVQSITEIQDTPEIPPAQVMEPVQVHEETSQSKEKSKEKQGGKQRTAAAVFVGTFGALPEVHFLHAIYHFKAQEVRIQRFKPCMIWS